MPASPTTSVRQPPPPRAIAWWLAICAAMIFIMVVIGGATRLTESGLSMVEWKPLHVVPPLNEAQWQDEFSAYRTSPEYLLKNAGMSLGDFKKIYWFEFTHRLWGRIIGIVFALPLLWFIWRGAVDRPLFYKLGGLFVLGGAQGALGWFMVASGLVDRPDVSQYRLAAHLCLAFTVYGLIVWVALDLFGKDAPASVRLDPATRRLSAVLPFFALVVIGAGAFVAGINAGLIYNTFPLMDGRVIPEALYSMDPWYLSAFEDATTVQFNHRVAAITLVILVAVAWWRGRGAAAGRTQTVLNALMIMALVQAALGISTLVLQVPLGLALAHQAGALMLFTLTVWFAHTQRRVRAEPARAGSPLHAEPAE
ncbi:MAG: COX15/CtaA family protein [Rhodospirillaceae bacterium]